MTLTDEQATLAQQLFEAYQQHTPLDQADFVDVVADFETAYQVQDAVMAQKACPRLAIKYR